MNTLHFGDNLTILRDKIADESVDLIYLDPPFNSNATYNVLFREKSGEGSAAQIEAFGDTWAWGAESEQTYHELITTGPKKLADLVQALRAALGTNDMMAYLTMMAIRLAELHRVLKPTGSIYLHCDPTASHYLKVVMDAIFSPRNFRSEIVWRRTNSHNKTSRQYGPIHDIILFYSKTDDFVFHPGHRPYSKAYIEDRFKYHDERGQHQRNYLTGPGTRKGESGQPWHGFDPTEEGRHWAIPHSLLPFLPNNGEGMKLHAKLDLLLEQELIVFPQKEGGQPMYKQYIGPGVPFQDIWAYQPNTKGVLFESDECIDEDVKYLEGEDEKIGFDTQKPIGLLNRIIQTSCNKDDLVLDPFCGCGTAVIAAEQMHRRWIGIDITHLAITLIKHRLHDTFGADLSPYTVEGVPADLLSARALAETDRHKFEWWALGLVDARPAQDKKKGADSGIDGYINFFDDESGKAKRIVVQVKSGHVTANQVRDLRGVMEREQAAIGLFVTLNEPTQPMRDEAVTSGFYAPPGVAEMRFPRLQILTIADLLAGKVAQYPRFARTATFKQAARQRKAGKDDDVQLGLEIGGNHVD